jgi:rare lipoprotein A
MTARLPLGGGLLLAATLAASGCALVGYPGGVPDVYAKPTDRAEVADAVPRDEALSPYGNMPEYQVDGVTYHVLASARGYEEEGTASWYGKDFQGKRTSSGEPYDMYAMTAAHRTLPLPTYVEVTNLENGKVVVVRVNDRGPFHSDRLIDLSYVAAEKLGIVGPGTARVRVRALAPGEAARTQGGDGAGSGL